MKKKNSSYLSGAVAIAIITSTMTGCATMNQPGGPAGASQGGSTIASIFDSPNPCSNNDRNIGMALGALTGALVGGLTHGVKGAVVGAVVGVGGGYLIGHFLDVRRCELYKIAKEHDLKLASAKITPAKLGVTTASPGQTVSSQIGLDVQLQNKEGEFDAGTAIITPEAREYLSQIAQQYNPTVVQKNLPANATPEQRMAATNHSILIVGHTNQVDEAVSGMSAAKLSQMRAKAVAEVFAENGVPANNIYYQGAGDALPIAPVHTATGAKENNRVQIVDVPTVPDLQEYVQRRTVNLADFAPQSQPTSPSMLSGHARPTQEEIHHKVSPTHRAPVVAHAQVSRGITAAQSIDTGAGFGGAPVSGHGIPVDLGPAQESHSMFGLIATAQADAPVIAPPCLESHYRPVTTVRNLATGQALPPRDYIPGFYDSVWVARAGRNLVAITHAKVLKGAGTYVPRPDVLIYRDYNGNTKQAPAFNGKAPVNVYRAENKTLYQVFVNGPAKCIDMIVPSGTYQGESRIYYGINGENYLARPSFTMQR